MATFVEEPPRRKRLKVATACTECRRRKTKCDGTQPCANCIKSKSNCFYVAPASTPKVAAGSTPREYTRRATLPIATTSPSNNSGNTANAYPAAFSSASTSNSLTSISAVPTNASPVAGGIISGGGGGAGGAPASSTHRFSLVPPRSMSSPNIARHASTRASISKADTNTTLAHIEDRLAAIEDTLHFLLEQQQLRHHTPTHHHHHYTPPPHPHHSHPQQQQQQQQQQNHYQQQQHPRTHSFHHPTANNGTQGYTNNSDPSLNMAHHHHPPHLTPASPPPPGLSMQSVPRSRSPSPMIKKKSIQLPPIHAAVHYSHSPPPPSSSHHPQDKPPMPSSTTKPYSNSTDHHPASALVTGFLPADASPPKKSPAIFSPSNQALIINK
ncbi:hypothetical protein BC940DRAFT_286737 [Gongronella butleri]|nr:hypothetical protein BC940DRAFT_286737 [Gongronella butleri]